MTGDVRQDVEAELSHGEDSLRAAQALLQLDLPNEAAGRIYYAVFHAARALLFAIGIAPRPHEALRTLIAQHFVNPDCSHRPAQKTWRSRRGSATRATTTPISRSG